MGHELQDDRFDACAHPDDTGCTGIGTLLRYARSMFIQGECRVMLRHNGQDGWAGFTEPGWIGGAQYFNINSNCASEGDGGYGCSARANDDYYSYKGCYPNHMAGSNPPSWPDTTPGHAPINFGVGLSGIMIQPLIGALRVEITPITPPYDTGNYDDISIGYLSHPYMCTVPIIKLLEELRTPTTGPAHIAYPANSYILFDAPVIPIATSLTYVTDSKMFFFTPGQPIYVLLMFSLKLCSETTKPLLRCTECQIRPLHQFTWFQQFYTDTFIDQVDVINQINANGGTNEPTKLIVNYWDWQGIYRSHVDIDTIIGFNAYGHLLSKFRLSDYGHDLNIDSCLKVSLLSTNPNYPYPYVFTPTSCFDNLYGVCSYDLKRTSR
jgi:hypothetical protein